MSKTLLLTKDQVAILKGVQKFTSKDETRYALTFIQILNDGDCIKAIATDGIKACSVEIAKRTDSGWDEIEYPKYISTDSFKYMVSQSDRHGALVDTSIFFTSDINFPNTKAVMPKKLDEHFVAFNLSQLLDILPLVKSLNKSTNISLSQKDKNSPIQINIECDVKTEVVLMPIRHCKVKQFYFEQDEDKKNEVKNECA